MLLWYPHVRGFLQISNRARCVCVLLYRRRHTDLEASPLTLSPNLRAAHLQKETHRCCCRSSVPYSVAPVPTRFMRSSMGWQPGWAQRQKGRNTLQEEFLSSFTEGGVFFEIELLHWVLYMKRRCTYFSTGCWNSAPAPAAAPGGGARTAKVSKSEGVLLQNQLFGTRPAHPGSSRFIPAHPGSSRLIPAHPGTPRQIPGSGVMTRCWGPPFHTRRGSG